MATVISPDPVMPIHDGSSARDFAAHVRTFNAFLSALKWFVIHLAVLVVALYFGAIAGQPYAAFALVLVSAGLLAYGFMRRPGVRADLAGGRFAQQRRTPMTQQSTTRPREAPKVQGKLTREQNKRIVTGHENTKGTDAPLPGDTLKEAARRYPKPGPGSAGEMSHGDRSIQHGANHEDEHHKNRADD